MKSEARERFEAAEKRVEDLLDQLALLDWKEARLQEARASLELLPVNFRFDLEKVQAELQALEMRRRRATFELNGHGGATNELIAARRALSR